MKQVIIFCFVSFLLGVATDRIYFRSGENTQLQVTNLDSAKEKIQKLSDVEIAEYLAIKDLKSRYEKADEILGKILLIFMADLGIRVEGKGEKPKLVENQIPVGKTQSAQADPAAIQNSVQGTTSLQVKIKVNENQLAEVRNPIDADDFNIKAKIENLADVYSKFKPVRAMTGVWENYLGQFSGDIKLYVEDQRALPTNVSFVKVDEEIEFDINISDSTMFKTEFKGTSKPENLFNAIEGSSAVFLALDHYGSKYLQLYYTGSQRILVGNLYKKWEKPGEMKPLGSVRLFRR